MARSWLDIVYDPLAWGFRGVLAGILILVSGGTLASYARFVGSPLHTAVLTIGGGLFLLGAFIIVRIARLLRERTVALSGLPGPNYNWFLGFIEMLAVKDIHRYPAIWADQYGPLVRFRLLLFHGVMVTDPALAMHILHSPHFDKFEFAYQFLDPLLHGPSILTGPTDEHWRQVRKGVAPAFSTAHMREALQLVVDRSTQLVEFLKRIGPDKPQNVDKLLLRESMDVIGEFGFQKQLNALSSLDEPADKFEKGLSDVDVLLAATHEVERRLQEPLSLFTPWKQKLRHGVYLLQRYQKQVEGLLTHIKRSDPRKGSFAQLLLAAKHYKTGKPLTDAQMTPEIAALFFAGIDTTGHTGTWLLYLLSQHPEVEARVARELDALELLATPTRPQPRPVTYADLAKLEYLQAVVKEVLRIYPPVGFGQIRQAKADVTLAGKLRIPKGCLCWVPHYGIQNTKLNWEDPKKFIPERWLEPGTEYAKTLPLPKEWYQGLDLGGMDVGSAGSLTHATTDHVAGTRRPKRYFPFAEGPRNCVGQSLAKVSLVATAATLLASLSFRLADQMGGSEGVRKREQYTLVTGIDGGMWMHAVPRL